VPSLSVFFSVSTEGKTVAEALVADQAQGAELLAAARAASSQLAWAHSTADLSGLGFARQHGYRKMTGPPSRRAPGADVSPLRTEEDSPELWAAAYCGQWGHKTPSPDQWPLDLPPGTVTLCLRRDAAIAGVCRVDPAEGLIDAPGVVAAHRGDMFGYEDLLTAAMALADAPSVAVESWGEGPERTAVCERVGLATAEYTGGWEFVLPGGSGGRPPGI
jgi:hypothetical protein